MNSTRWQEVQELFGAALGAGPEERARLLDQSDADSETLEVVLRMLQADAAGGSVLDRGVPDAARELLVEPEDDMPRPPIAEFGPYRLIRLLGEGGMGVVWLAERMDTGSQVAVKFLPNAGLSPARLERFTREVWLLARLKHPSIARFYDAGTLADGTPWFVMEYVEGTPFGNYARSLDSVAKKIRLFRAVCEAVQYAHGQAIIHRDLKPSNILVESDGTPKLLDFGIARELEQDAEQTGMTVRGPRFLSPQYSAPEWIENAEAGVTTDVYSLGVMLYEVLAGCLPDCEASGSASKPSVAARQPAAESAAKPEGITRSEWNDLDVLCLKAMHANPAKRYGSVEALIRDIDHFLANEPLEVRPDSWSYRGAKFLRRNAKAVTATATVLTILAGMGIFFTLRLAEARNAALAEAARANRVQQFTLSLFKNSGNITDAPANLKVKFLLDHGAADADQLRDEPALQAELFENLGEMYRAIGITGNPADMYSRAIAIRDSLPKTPVGLRIDDRISLALLPEVLLQRREAEDLISQARQLTDQMPERDRKRDAEIEFAQGKLLLAIGNYQAARLHLQAAEKLQDKDPELASNKLATLVNLELTELNLGNYEECDRLNNRILALDRQQGSHDTARELEALQDLGTSAYIRGDYAQAEANERKAYAIAQSWFGKDHPVTANQMISLANVLTDEGKLREAGQLLHKAIAIEQKSFPAESGYLGKAWHYLGRFEAASGQFSQAVKHMETSENIFRKTRGEGDFLIGVVELSKGTAYQLDNDMVHAESSFRRALNNLAPARGENDIYTALARVHLGHTLLLEGHFREAELQSRIGYELLSQKTGMQTSFLASARQDLIADYQAMHELEKAESLRLGQ